MGPDLYSFLTGFVHEHLTTGFDERWRDLGLSLGWNSFF